MTQTNQAKFAFFYMLSLVALVFTAISTGIVIFQGINKNIKDIVDNYSGSFDPGALKFAISSLIIAVPIYYVVQWLINRSLFRGELAKDSAVRRWLTYFILLVSAVVMIFWLIFTVNSFLDGELTVKFALKALTAIGISAIIFSFYLLDIKREIVEGKKDRIITIYFYGSLAFVLAAFVFALFNVESPRETRLRRIDEMTTQRLDQTTYALDRFYSENNELPEALDELKDNYDFKLSETTLDPETKKPFEYRKISEKKYELCAEFRTSSQAQDKYSTIYNYNRWQHGIGRACFENQASGEAAKPLNEPNSMPVQ